MTHCDCPDHDYERATFLGFEGEAAEAFCKATPSERVNILAAHWRLKGIEAPNAMDMAKRGETPMEWASRRVREEREQAIAKNHPRVVATQKR